MSRRIPRLRPREAKNVFDFSQGLLTQVRGLEQFNFGALNQVTDVVDVLCLQAVSATYSQFQIINRTQQNRINFIFFLLRLRLCITFQINEDSQLLLQNSCSATDSFIRIQSTIGFQIDNQLVEVSTLFYTSTFDDIGNTVNRAVGGIQLQATDSTSFFFVLTTLSAVS